MQHRRRDSVLQRGLAVMAVMVLSLASTSAAGQTYGRVIDAYAYGAIATTAFALGVGTTIGGGVGTTIALAAGNSSSKQKETYIRTNALALQRDLTLGGGRAVDDLAAEFGVGEENVERFGAMVRSRRSDLLPLTDVHELDDERARRFFQIIVDGMRDDPRLRVELRELTRAG